VITPKTQLPAILDRNVLQETDFNEVIAKAEREVEAMKKIKIISLRSTNEGDWINRNGNPYLEVMGSMKVAQVWGISITEMSQKKEMMTDDKGQYYVVTTEGKAAFRNRILTEIGTCTSRDEFFGVKDKELKPMEDVVYENVVKASATNFHNRILKKILGLGFNWEDLEAAGLKKEKIRTIGNNERKASEDDQKKQVQLRNWLREMYGDAEHLKRLEELTPFVKKDGTKVAGVKQYEELSGLRLTIFYPKVETMYKNWQKEMKDQGKTTTEAPDTQTSSPNTETGSEPEEGGPQEKPTFSVEGAKGAGVGAVMDILALVGKVTLQFVGKKKIAKTDCEVYGNEDGTIVLDSVISIWGDHSKEIVEGDWYVFKAVIKSDYNGQTQYMAKSVELPK
jgi:ribosomal protein L13E